MKKRIYVRASDLRTADRSDLVDCPIARSLKRICKKSVHVSVDAFGFTLNDERIRSNGCSMVFSAIKPYSFIVDIPSPYLKRKAK